MKYYTSREAAKAIGVHPNTLRKMADSGKIEIIRISGQRRYDVESYLGEHCKADTVCYCRVSSHKQRDDLARQISYMQEKYPGAEIVKDIGSGLNFKRKGLKTLLERAMRGDKLKVVVAHRDRIARFGYELVRHVIEFNGGELLVLSEDNLSPETELTSDLLNIVHIFSCRMHGLRNYKKQVNKAIIDSVPA
jgi:putative resolvase